MSNVEFTHGDNDRETNPEWVDIGVLEKVIYPTGGIHEFSYEANSFVDIGTYVVSEELGKLNSCGAEGSSCCGTYSECCNPLTSFETDAIDFDTKTKIDSSRILLEFRVPPHVFDEPTTQDETNSFLEEYERCYSDYSFDPNASVSPTCASIGSYKINVEVYKVTDNSYVGGREFNINIDDPLIQIF